MKNKSGWYLNTVLYGMWLLIVLETAIYASHWEEPLPQLTGRLWLGLAATVIAAPCLLRWMRSRTLKVQIPGQKISPRVFRGICFSCSLLVLGFCFLGVNPGGFDGDPWRQLSQALTGEYDDFYPVMHTLIAFKLPLALTGGWFPSIILFQILLFSAALTLVCDTVRKYTNSFSGFVSLAAILMNPITQSYVMYVYKDETFGICAMVLVCMNARILFSRGEWLKKPMHLALFSVMLALCSLVRYNGFLFAVPCLLGAALCVTWRRSLTAGAAMMLLIVGVKGPIFSLMGVTSAQDRSSQTMGLPMAVIGGVYTSVPEQLDEETVAFAESVAPREVWEEKYEWGVYNWVDWDPRSNHQTLKEAGFAGALKYMFRAFREAPKASMKALIETTDITYGLRPDHLADGTVYLSGRELGLKDQGIDWIRSVMDGYRRVMYVLAPHSFLHSGVAMLLLLTAMLAKWPLNRKESWKRILPALSVFAYNLVTMLVLFSWWDGARFFHYSLWVLPVLMVMLIRSDTVANGATLPGE